jgi:ribosomal-protein-alanine N-acetyltransferase
LTDGVVRFQAMALADLPSVLAIERLSFPSPWTEANFRQEIERNEVAWNVVAREGEVLAGYACAYVVAGELMINNVAVDPSRRQAGVGRRLVGYLLEGARVRGCRRATLEVRPSNVAARRLYETLGFAYVGRRPGYYADTGEDALLMSRDL